MSMKGTVLAAILTILAVSASAQEVRVIEPEDQEKATSPQCGGGVVYDDGVFEAAYSLGSGNPNDATIVTKFDLPAGTTSLDQACVCFGREAAAPTSMSFQILVYDDNGPSSQPGTLLATVNATANAIPVLPAANFYSINLAGSGISLPNTSVYIGARWPGGQTFMCGDRSPATPLRSAYGSLNSGLSWNSLQNIFAANPPRAMAVRVDPATTSSSTCTPNSTTLCLNGGRFKVEATYQTPSSGSGSAQVVLLTNDTGYLWFFAASNVEAVVKVLNGCGLNNRYWVFAGGLTNVRTVIRVTDTSTGAVKTYINPQNTAFQPIQDTAAFATCP